MKILELALECAIYSGMSRTPLKWVREIPYFLRILSNAYLNADNENRAELKPTMIRFFKKYGAIPE